MTYKDLIFNAIGDLLKDNQVTKIYFNFEVKTGIAKVLLIKLSGR